MPKYAVLLNGRVEFATEALEFTCWQGTTGPEHLFTLKQSFAAYRHYQKLLPASDRKIEQQLKRFEARVDEKAQPLPPPDLRSKKPFSNAR